VDVAGVEADGVLAGPLASGRVVPTVEVILQPGVGVDELAGVLELATPAGVRLDHHLAEAAVAEPVLLHPRAVGDQPHRAEPVAVLPGGHTQGADTHRRGCLLGVQVTLGQGAGAVEVCPRLVAVAVGTQPGGAGVGVVAGGLDQPALVVVYVVQPYQQDAPVAGAQLGPGHLVFAVVAVRPGLVVGPLALLDAVALRVVTVTPRAVADQPVVAVDDVAGHGAVAGGVVAEARAACCGQLVGVVVAVGRTRPAGRLVRHPAGQVVVVAEVQ